MLFEPTVAATLDTVATMADGVVEAWSLMLCGASDPQTVTVLSPAKPRSAASGSHGEAASFSARQYEYLPGWPWVGRSSFPGRAPATFCRTRRRAGPMTALARAPCRSTLPPAWMPRRRAIGPLTMRSGEHGWVVV